MGGSGGGIFDHRAGSDRQAAQATALTDAAVAAFQATLSEMLGDLLSGYNDRDHALAAERLERVLDSLRQSHDGAFDKLFGGSVAKHTYVDGLSDVDCLIIVNGSDLQGGTPGEALANIIRVVPRVAPDATVEAGRMAVTVRYPDRMELQLLPAVSDGDGRLRVADASGTGWSRIDPRGFRDVLTRRNEACAGKLVPTIKLAKAVMANVPECEGLSGYHVESLAIEAFRGYDGVRTTAAMLPAFFERARTLVLEPMRDSTGQSVHVDAGMGPPNSAARQAASHALGRVARQMRTASAAGSSERWAQLFGLEE